MSQRFGGNLVQATSGQTDEVLAARPYWFSLHRRGTGEELRVSLGSCLVLVLEAERGTRLRLVGLPGELQREDVVLAEQHPVRIAIDEGQAELLVAGTRQPSGRATGLRVIPLCATQRVDKPWGYERWISGEHPGFSCKQIQLHQGHRTSLQYHHQKEETSYLRSGQAALHYAVGDTRGGGTVQSVTIEAGSFLQVRPLSVHRIEARSDIELFEVSTPHLDDVVRIEEDHHQPDGRIEAEHG